MLGNFCKGCGRKLNTMPLVGERVVEFEEGFYCLECARKKIDRKRRII